MFFQRWQANQIENGGMVHVNVYNKNDIENENQTLYSLCHDLYLESTASAFFWNLS